MEDRTILKGILYFLGIVSWFFGMGLWWITLEKINADNFMYFLFFIWILFGLAIHLLREKVFDTDSRLKKLEDKLK